MPQWISSISWYTHSHTPHSLCIQWQVSKLFWPLPSFTVHPMTGEQIVLTTPLIHCASNDRWANCFDHTPHSLCIQWQVSKLFWPLPSFTVHPMTGEQIVLTTPLIHCASNDRWANCFDHTPHSLCIQMTGEHIVLTTPLIHCVSNDRWVDLVLTIIALSTKNKGYKQWFVTMISDIILAPASKSQHNWTNMT